MDLELLILKQEKELRLENGREVYTNMVMVILNLLKDFLTILIINSVFGKHPFKDLAILPQRINIALGSVTQKNRGDLSKKIGADYFRNLSVDDLMMQEKDFGKKILIFDANGNHVGKKLETPYQNAKRMVNIIMT